jgi:hypothetical protein
MFLISPGKTICSEVCEVLYSIHLSPFSRNFFDRKLKLILVVISEVQALRAILAMIDMASSFLKIQNKYSHLSSKSVTKALRKKLNIHFLLNAIIE